MDKHIYICDTNVLLSSLLSKKSPPHQSVRYILKNGLLAFSNETFSELHEVINREKFDKYIPVGIRKTFLDNLRNNSVFYEIENTVNICRDPKDNKFLDVAIASYAEHLITGDEDLLVLKHIGNASIITPRKFTDIHTE